MGPRLMFVTAVVAAMTAPTHAQELRIGFMATQTGGAAITGQHAINGWKIGLKHEGWTKDGDQFAGVRLRMFYADDQLKPDVALKEIERLISSERIHIGAGFMWTNVILAVRTPLIENKKIILGTLDLPARIVVGGAVAAMRLDERVEAIERLQQRRLARLVLANEAGDVADLEAPGIADALELGDMHACELHRAELPLPICAVRPPRLAASSALRPPQHRHPRRGPRCQPANFTPRAGAAQATPARIKLDAIFRAAGTDRVYLFSGTMQ